MFEGKDYENVLKTVFQLSNIDIQQSREDFKLNVLEIFRDILCYHHSVFWEVAEGELNETPTVLNIEQYTVQDYLTTYKYYDPLHPANMQNQPTIQLIHQHDNISLKKKNYYQDYFLKHTYFKDEMVMYLKDGHNSLAAIGFLRNKDEENFHLKDALKLSYVRKALENVYLLWENAQPTRLNHITMREEELLNYICKGYKNHEIAKLLFVSENTIKKHLQNLYRKCQVSNRTQLALIYSKL
ncbi:LuxR C-terminal-related transcriptional regulator [Solibacillus sp. FSL K6-1781]|uniref:response regulator transcription factor n=1 Tax=Solibacillus sp. FSL K6-1781 TaxID=2921474 RepID=UPI00315AA49E